jgi:hypothetical protein
LIFCDGSATMRGPKLSQKMPRTRIEAEPARTGRTWSPIKGLTLTERGPLHSLSQRAVQIAAAAKAQKNAESAVGNAATRQ